MTRALLLTLLASGCAPIHRPPTQTVEDFCGDFALMRWSPDGDPAQRRTFAWWYRECLTRETFRK